MSKRFLPPGFFILGVQKGGTSTLHSYLSKSKEIYFPFKKELHFFDAYYNKGMQWYNEKFTFEDNENIKISGEATPYYYFHPQIPKKIYREYPNAKFIVVYRNPVERAFSHYQMSVRRNLETRTFEEAIQGEEKFILQQQLKMIFNKNFNLEHVEKSYVSRGFYAKQLKRWLKLFPQSSFLFLESEALFSNPQPEVDKVTNFLNINPIKVEEKEIVNAGSYNKEINPNSYTRLMEKYLPDIEELKQITGINFNWFN